MECGLVCQRLFNGEVLRLYTVSITTFFSHIVRSLTGPLGPAQHLLEYENVALSPLTIHTKYHGPPSPAVDEAWEDLYESQCPPLSGLLP